MSGLDTVLKGAALAVLLMANPALAHGFKAGGLEIEHPWSRATPPGAKVAAGYVTIENEGDAADRLLSATAEIAGRTEIHEMAVKDGIMTMRPLPDGVSVPAKGEARLAPSGIHLMFMDLKRQPKQGESFAGTLTFEKAGEVKVKFAVQSIGATDPDHGGMDHGHMGHGTEKTE
jgi:copper(I)-binding protein